MVPLWAVIAAAVAGAIIGDSVGYLIGRRWGTHLLHGTLGRLPVIRTHLDKNLDSARAYVQRRRGSAVFFGRFTAALRVLVPGLAGISEVHYPTFLAYNVAGGTLWGAGFAVLGYVAGASYHRVEKVAGQAGLILLGVIVAGLITSRLVRHFAARSPGLKAVGDRLAAAPPLAWVRRRFPAQVAWGRRRLDAHNPRGFWLTFTVAAGAARRLGLRWPHPRRDRPRRHGPGRPARDRMGHRPPHRVADQRPASAHLARVDRGHHPRRASDRPVFRHPAPRLAATDAADGGRRRCGRPVSHRQVRGRPAPPARRDLDRALHRCLIPVRTRHPIRRLLRDARHRARSRAVVPQAGHLVERRCPGRTHRRRLPHLPRSPLADRRARRLRPRCLLGGHRGGRPADHLVRHRPGKTVRERGQAPTPGASKQAEAA
jgi:membrane protein DedA with SNARE-associated domain